MYKVPKTHRPTTGHFKQFVPGVDLAGGFFDDIRSIDTRLHFIWHPYKVEYENVMNTYYGLKKKDPRFFIHEEHGKEVWGWVLKNPNDIPMLEEQWHIWELHTHGWSHVCPILFSDPDYLSILARRMYLQGRFADKYGHMAYHRDLSESQEKEQSKAKEDLEDLEIQIAKENQWFYNKAAENFRSGRVAPTNPTKEQIMSYPGQTKRSKVVTPLTDREGGLYVPEEYN